TRDAAKSLTIRHAGRHPLACVRIRLRICMQSDRLRSFPAPSFFRLRQKHSLLLRDEYSTMATVVGSPTGEQDDQSDDSVSEDRRLADSKARALLNAELHALGTSPLRRPSATYRLQVHGGFRFQDVESVVGYLSALGVSDCYFSPYLDARPGSMHGY